MLHFGTDGVRGDAELFLTDVRVRALARAAASVLGGSTFVVGRDSRESGERIEAAFVAGLADAGIGAALLGVAPTPAVAHSSAARGDAGVVISASHNRWSDNGIKLFSPGGLKLSDATQQAIEARWEQELTTGNPAGDAADAPVVSVALDSYAESVVASTAGRRLDGLRLVVDCANGAGSTVAPEVLRRLGAEVSVLHATPDGRNINDGCGSTHPGDLQAAVVAQRAHLGLALDGDADRVLAVDEMGAVVDGDRVIALCALDLRQRGMLRGDAVVVTVMTNLGFRQAMSAAGVKVVETAVGDRYVLEALERDGASIGGEQSGHVIFRDLATTGDGLLTGVQFAELLARAGRPCSELAGEAFTWVPQVLRNVRVDERPADVAAELAGPIKAAEGRLGDDGRVLVRASGTEPLVRVMVEAVDAARADAVAGELVDAVISRWGGITPG